MLLIKNAILFLLKLIFFWILVFDFQRILFSIHHWDRLEGVSLADWLLTFVYSFRLDFSTAAYLCALPLLFYVIHLFQRGKWTRRFFLWAIYFEVIIVTFVHAGEINAYTEWGHKLTSRVFMHLSNPDEVFRSADYSMTIWFVIYSILEVMFAWRLTRWLFKSNETHSEMRWFARAPIALATLVFFLSSLFLAARGGWQPIPLNIDSAYFSNTHIANDLSVNSLYYFGSSYIAYSKSDIDHLIPKMDSEKAERISKKLHDYPRKHDNYFLKDQKPNIVFVVMESWPAEGIGCLSETKGATPGFDALAEEGVLFTNIYANGTTSEIGNACIFSANPAIPEVSISTQPEKSRKIPAINQNLATFGYSSHYIFSGDLKYGNIGGFFLDHGFDDVKDENDFPAGLKRGKLNYYDEDLYTLFLERINATKGKFMHCAFTGSTHSPFDQPKRKNQTWKGIEAPFMNSLIYADGALSDFIKKCKKEPWFENTLFVFMADHSHHTPTTQDLYDSKFYRIPLLFWGEPIKEEYRGARVDKLGSQVDFAATLFYQMGIDSKEYRWSKDLMNPKSAEFAFHLAINSYGWITPNGGLTYHYEFKKHLENTFSPSFSAQEIVNCQAYLNATYKAYKEL